MNRKLWVVEAIFEGGFTEPCDFTDLPYTDENFYEAHKKKRAIQKYLYEHGCSHWTKKTIIVTLYKPSKQKH